MVEAGIDPELLIANPDAEISESAIEALANLLLAAVEDEDLEAAT